MAGISVTVQLWRLGLSFLCTLGFFAVTVSTDLVRMCVPPPGDCQRFEFTLGIWKQCLMVLNNSNTYCHRWDQRRTTSYHYWVRGLMVTGTISSLLTLVLEAFLVLLVLSACFRQCCCLGTFLQAHKDKCVVAGRVLKFIAGVCGVIALVWYLIGVHRDESVIDYGASLMLGCVSVGVTLLSVVYFTLLDNCANRRTPRDEGTDYDPNLREPTEGFNLPPPTSVLAGPDTDL
ncbi:claudin-11-like [Syngnathus typhle]